MAEHPIQGIMSTTLQKIKEMIDVNTIIGTPVTATDGTVIIPVSKVSFGFGAGGSEFGGAVVKEDGLKSNFGGGSGAGVSISPVAFLVVGNGDVRLLTLSSENTSVDKIIDMIPEILNKFKSMTDKGDKKPKEEKIKFHDDYDDIVVRD